jgi:hypothetical protein
LNREFLRPLGLPMLAYILWGEQFEGFKRQVNTRASGRR